MPVLACSATFICTCRYGLASVLHAVVNSLEELFVEKCYDLITTAALRAMGGCKKLKVQSVSRHRHICFAAPRCCDSLALQFSVSDRQALTCHMPMSNDCCIVHAVYTCVAIATCSCPLQVQGN